MLKYPVARDQKLENLEETVRFLMFGRPIKLYQKKLQQWLDLNTPISQVDSKSAEPIRDSEEEAGKQPPIPEKQSRSIEDAFVRDAQDEFPVELTAPNINDDRPPTISQKGESKPTDIESEEKVASLTSKEDKTFPLQVNNVVHTSAITFPLTLPLLVGQVLRYIPQPNFELPISEGKTRVRWISVRPSICWLNGELTCAIGWQTQI
jgi:hypothetical protein